ncbi:MAG: beta-ketoacyl synthase N-terminal-like domain-containing protein [Acidobacteriota bacterium]
MQKRRVVVTGVGTVSSLGNDPAQLHSALVAGETGFRDVDLFDTEGLRSPRAAQVDFDPRAFFGKRNFRPVDRTGRLVIAAAELALGSAGITAEALADLQVGLVLGTMFGSVHTISAFDRRGLEAGPKYVKPLDFANSVINAAAGQAAIWHGLRGSNSTVAGGTTAGLQALARGLDMVRLGRGTLLLAGGGEELCFESMMGFQQAGRLARDGGPDGPFPRPFDADGSGVLLGEGSALLMLEEAEHAEGRGATVRAEILGHGSFFDVSRGADPEVARSALERAARLALDDAGLGADDVDLVTSGGSGLVPQDRIEARAIASVLGDRAGEVPVMAVKGAIGECLGASGAFQVMAAIEAVAHGEVPPIAGFEAAAADGPSLGFAARSRALRGGRVLATALGLSGNATALVLDAGRLGTGGPR